MTAFLLDPRGRPKRAARRWLGAALLAAFVIAFAVSLHSSGAEPAVRTPAPAKLDAAPPSAAPSRLRDVAPLPVLRVPASSPVRTAPSAPTTGVSATPTTAAPSATPAPTTTTTTQPTTTQPTPTPAATTPAQAPGRAQPKAPSHAPSKGFDSTGSQGFDSSG